MSNELQELAVNIRNAAQLLVTKLAARDGNSGKRTMTADTAAAVVGVSARRIRAVAAQRGIGEKIGRDWMFSPADVERIKNARKTK